MADGTVANSPALVGANQNVYDNPLGNTTVYFNWTANGTTMSSSQLILMAKIPHGAVITNLQGAGWIGCAGNATLDWGLSGEASADFLIDGTAISATATAALTIQTGALPHTCSLSDDTSPRWRYLVCKLVSAATATQTMIVRGSVTYRTGMPVVSN